MERETGRYEVTVAGGETVRAFMPHPLPPQNPPVDLSGSIGERLRIAEQSLGRLELAGAMVPNLDWFIYAFVRKEAVISSQIEGTQATLVDLLTYEAAEPSANPAEPTADVQEVCNYIDALHYARAELANPYAPPLSMRLLNGTHERLMRGVRGATKLPGEIRRSQNWIGGSRPGNAAFVPAPPHLLPEALSALEHYIHADDALPPLIRAGLLHVQFETIHPYLDGNGRIGRLLVSLLLEHWKLLTRPLLYLSLFFKRHRSEYYRRLNAVRMDGDWEGWLDYFLHGVATIGEEAVVGARDLFALVGTDRARLLARPEVSVAALRLFEALPRSPIVTAGTAMNALTVSRPTAGRAIETLVESGILLETTGRRRDRSFAYDAYLKRLREGTELGEP